ncbi:MAG: biopolymer transporter ExbD [Candidatus Azobacteroides sp.]|nr:biopolymer transporter ExbD [Candidatus Azobacteroides sp.]
MPKVKVKRKSTFIDMTAMSDVTVLLLTFFMLTSTFIKKEPVQVSTPGSVSEIKIPETDIMQILIDPKGHIFMSLDKQTDKIEVLKKISEKYGVEFTPKEIKDFSLLPTFGMPVIRGENADKATVEKAITLINQNKINEKNPIGVKLFMALPTEMQDKVLKHLGIPNDSLNNQFKDWVGMTRHLMDSTNRGDNFKIAIKADAMTPYPVIKQVMSDLRDLRENRYNLITSLKGGGSSFEESKH